MVNIEHGQPEGGRHAATDYNALLSEATRENTAETVDEAKREDLARGFVELSEQQQLQAEAATDRSRAEAMGSMASSNAAMAEHVMGPSFSESDAEVDAAREAVARAVEKARDAA